MTTARINNYFFFTGTHQDPLIIDIRMKHHKTPGPKQISVSATFSLCIHGSPKLPRDPKKCFIFNDFLMEVLSFKYMIYYSSNVSPYSRNAVRLQVAKKVFLLDSQSQVQKFLSWIFTFSHFHFFSKYIATFIYHAFYCIAIAQVRIIQEDRRERDEKKRNKYLCRGLVITESE